MTGCQAVEIGALSALAIAYLVFFVIAWAWIRRP